ncbi:M56 family metallopeptidase [Nonomuraea sp. NPDC049750]|uniref:M56 family metallopeptidase n=1 Tax=Nonomuraea sp. NPDC049750 TaxID=3154738 RepID=UPI0033F6F66C
MIVYLWRHNRVGLAVLAGLIGVRLVWHPSVSAGMTMAQCWLVSIAVVAGASLLAVAARATWLGVAAARSLAALPRAAEPAGLEGAIRRSGVPGVVCLAGANPAAFCAGVLRPRLYLTAGAAEAIPAEELDAILVHEAAHARRRDPLRRLMLRAAADVLFFLPLAGWWFGRQSERAELSADRAAIDRLGAKAVARALARMDGAGPALATAAAFHGAAEARIAQLLGDDLPIRKPSRAGVIFSLTGLVVVVSLVMCVGQAAWAALTA